MSKREIVIRVDAKTLALAVGFMAVGYFAPRLYHLAGRIVSHLPRPHLSISPPKAKGPVMVVLCDFESEDDLRLWKTRSAKLTRSSEHATHGQWAARLFYPAQKGGPAALIEDALEENRLPVDWASYDEVVFDIYNPQTRQERVILQLKDQEGHASKQNLYLNPESRETVRVSLAEVRHSLDLSRVGQFNLFRWDPKQASTFFIDHLRLVRGEEPAATEAPSASARPSATRPPIIQTAAGFVLGVEDGTTKIFKDPRAFQGERATHVHLRLARNEFEAFQVALYQAEAQLADVQINASDLVHDNGQAKIDRLQIRVRQARYVHTEKPDYPVSHVGWWPDPLVDTNTVSVDAGEVQPIWVTIRTRPDTPPGHYRGTLTLRAATGNPIAIQVEVTVWDFVLPVTGHLKTAFDFYTARMRRAYENWLPEAFAKWEHQMGQLEHRYFLALLDHRISPILNVDPARDPTADIRLAEYLARGLTAFGVGKHGGSFDNDWPDDQAVLDAKVAPYRQMALYLQRNGLLDRAYVYTYDEPEVGKPKVAQVASTIHWMAPGLKNLVVLHDLSDPTANPAWWKDIDIVVVRNTAVSEKYLNILRQWGKEIWLYVSGPSHPYPTLVLDYPAMAARILPWMCWKANATGLLYWSVNYWTKNPWEDPMNTKWGQNGNGSLLYPGPDGPVDSIRLEVLRDGIEDYEYLVLLQQLVSRMKSNLSTMADATVQGLITEAERLLAIDPKLVESMRTYNQNPDVLERNRTAIAQMIEKLQSILGD